MALKRNTSQLEMELLTRFGIEPLKCAAILSGRSSKVVEHRASELRIAYVLQGHEYKGPPFRNLIEQLGLAPSQVCFVGDDLMDLSVLHCVGLAICPADAVPEVKDAVHFVTGTAGGRGVIREVVELILKCQGSWPELEYFTQSPVK